MFKVRTIIRGLSVFFAVLASLAFAAFAAGAVYYLVTRYNPWDFVSPHAARVMVLNDGIGDRALPEVFQGQFQGIQALRALRERLLEVAGAHPSLTQILARLGKRVLLAEMRDGKGILIADTGWQSLLLAGGGLAVRSIFNPEGKVRFSASEASTAGIDYILYGITPADEEEPFHLALFGNILLAAEDAGAIAASIRESRTQGTGTAWEPLAEAFPLENISILCAPGFDPVYIPARERIGVAERGSACTLRIEPRESVHISLCVLFESLQGDGQGAARILRSNQYRARYIQSLGDELASCTVLLFDDIEELVGLVSELGAHVYEIGELERQGIHDWAANELTFFTWRDQDFVHIRPQNTRRALSALRGPDAENVPGNIVEENEGYTLFKAAPPAFMRAFSPFAPKIARLEYCAQQKNEFIFAERTEHLQALMKRQQEGTFKPLPDEAFKSFGEKANILLYRKGASAFFPSSAALAEAAGLDAARLFSVSKIKTSAGQIQAEIYLGVAP